MEKKFIGIVHSESGILSKCLTTHYRSNTAFIFLILSYLSNPNLKFLANGELSRNDFIPDSPYKVKFKLMIIKNKREKPNQPVNKDN
jgi:hypothetical protein